MKKYKNTIHGLVLFSFGVVASGIAIRHSPPWWFMLACGFVAAAYITVFLSES